MVSNEKYYHMNDSTIYKDDAHVVGNYNNIIGDRCTVNGNDNTIRGAACIVTGHYNKIESVRCRVKGNENTINGELCTIRGHYNKVSGHNCTAVGNDNQLYGSNSSAHGHYNKLHGDNCRAEGNDNIIYGSGGWASGNCNKVKPCNATSGNVTPRNIPTANPISSFTNVKIDSGIDFGFGDSVHCQTPVTTTKREHQTTPSCTHEEEKMSQLSLPTGTDEPSSQGDIQSCLICMGNKPRAVFIDCGHMVLCIACTNELLTRKKESTLALPQCPLCRKCIVKGAITVFC